MQHSNTLGTLVLRLALGAVLISHALVKLLVFTLPGTVKYFESLGLPGFFAYLVFAGELGGGLLIVLGVKVRLIAALVTPILIGATFVHVPNGWQFGNSGGGWEYPAFLAAVSIALVFMEESELSLEKKFFPGSQS